MPASPYRTGFTATAEDGAKLTFDRPGPKRWRLLYEPAPRALEIAANIDRSFVRPQSRFALLECDNELDVLTTHPLNTAATSSGFLQPKYDSLRAITFDGFYFADLADVDDVTEALTRLPSGFVKDPYFGLGLNFDIRFIVESVEKLAGLTELRIRKGVGTGLPKVESGTYTISASSFDKIRKSLRRIHSTALSVAIGEKHALAHNDLLYVVDPTAFPEAQPRYRKDAVLQAIGDSLSRPERLSVADRKAAAGVTSASARTMARKEPAVLLELSRTIETVTLERLIEKMKDMLARNLSEDAWQSFFKDNPFVLKMAFGYPVIKIGDQVSVGGRKFSGRGDKIADFALKAAASGNIALVEIKRPGSALVETNTYRGGLHPPHRELSGAVNQVLDQRYQLQRSLPVLKDTSGISDIESYAIQGLVVSGRTPTDKDMLKSFELFRNGLKSVSVITFDELLGKLEFLLEVFNDASEVPSDGDDQEDDDGDIADLEEEFGESD